MTATGTAPARTPLDTGRLRARLAAGEPTVGTFLGMASPVAAEVCAAAGPDWVLLDLEHGGGGEEQVGATVLAAGAYGVPTVVRVETDARIRLGRVLDLGAAGVMLPRLSSAAEVAEAVGTCATRPGATAASPPTTGPAASASTRARWTAPTARCSASSRSSRPRPSPRPTPSPPSTASTCCSSAPATSATTSACPATSPPPRYLEALEAVRAAAARHGKACGLLAGDGAAARRLREQGWRFVGIGSDSTLLAAALGTALAAARTDDPQGGDR